MRSIKVRLTIYFAIFLLLILSLSTYLLYQNAYDNRISNFDNSLYVIISDIVAETKETLPSNNIDELKRDILYIDEKFIMAKLYISLVYYEREDKSVVVRSYRDGEFSFSFNDSLDSSNTTYSFYKNYRVASRVFRVDGRTLLAQTAVKIEYNDSTMATLIIVDIMIFFFSIIGSYLLISRAIVPVDRVVESVNSINSYEYKKRLKVADTPVEIEKLVDTFNRLLARQQKSFDKISQFSSDVSHELKTPLTTIRGEIEVGLQRDRSTIEYKKILKISLKKIEDIQEIVDTLLFLANSNRVEIVSTFREVYIDEVVIEAIEELQYLAKKNSIELKVSSIVALSVRGDFRLLKLAIINIIKNAIIYSPNGSVVKIGVEEGVISIVDSGVGISAEDLEHIFDRFYSVERLEYSRGLGLSIVKAILDIHGFRIKVSSRVGVGSSVEVYLS